MLLLTLWGCSVLQWIWVSTSGWQRWLRSTVTLTSWFRCVSRPTTRAACSTTWPSSQTRYTKKQRRQCGEKKISRCVGVFESLCLTLWLQTLSVTVTASCYSTGIILMSRSALCSVVSVWMCVNDRLFSIWRLGAAVRFFIIFSFTSLSWLDKAGGDSIYFLSSFTVCAGGETWVTDQTLYSLFVLLQQLYEFHFYCSSVSVPRVVYRRSWQQKAGNKNANVINNGWEMF